MKYFSPRIIRRAFSLSLIGIFLTVLYISNSSFLKAPKAESATNSLSGFAWSDNVGWVSFSNTSDGTIYPYSVKIDTTTGNLSGSAWSDNIGWISFDRTATNSPPSAPFNTGSGTIASLDLSTGKVTGWARALAGCENTPGLPVTSCTSSGAGTASLGWDGWIKLSDDGNANWVGKGVSVDLTTGKFSGYAWGDEVVGWIDFAPTVGGVPVAGVAMPPTKCIPLMDPSGVCSSTQVCSASGGGICIDPNGTCSSDFDCGGSQKCNSNSRCVSQGGVCSTTADCVSGQSCVRGTCRPPGYCSIPTDCVSGVCDIATHTCATGSGSGCGDKICGTGESLLSCPQDCKVKVQQF